MAGGVGERVASSHYCCRREGGGGGKRVPGCAAGCPAYTEAGDLWVTLLASAADVEHLGGSCGNEQF